MLALPMKVGSARALVLATCLCYAKALCVSVPLHHAPLQLPGCRLPVPALPVRSRRRLWAPAGQMLADAGDKRVAASNGDGAFAGLGEQIGRALGENEHVGAAATEGASAGGVRGEDAVSANAQDSGWMAKWSDVATGIVLIVGDGNLSFSLALARAFPKMRLIATTFDSGLFICVRLAGGPRSFVSCGEPSQSLSVCCTVPCHNRAICVR